MLSCKAGYSRWLIALGLWLAIANSFETIAFSQNPSSQSSLRTQRKFVCHEQSLEILITQLLRDLPSYANRASQRGRRLRRSSDIYSYMLVAGRPEFQPLPLKIDGSHTDGQKNTASDVEQVFFTTLERQYVGKKIVELEEFHWLFLTKTANNRRFVMMFSQIGTYPLQQPPSPPRDSSNGSVAQGIKAWLRDCQAGSVRVRSQP
ncbi:hypothetical protein [Nostoc sp. NIES-3756]|uniref:hypothetical protein n=1 Tax=Nostoc sp. NIES-3756 TaxID=1751286 RepID=UPI000BBBEDF7|nr:hypothetical protein [Nostoc sp. NIES-3756]